MECMLSCVRDDGLDGEAMLLIDTLYIAHCRWETDQVTAQKEVIY